MRGLEIPPIEKIDVNTLVHATEDEEKVKMIISSLIPAETHPTLKIIRLSGHYGNPISLMTVSIRSKGHMENLLKELFAKLGPGDKAALLEELPLHVAGNGAFYLRLNKQAAAKGIVSLGEEDPIQIKIKFKPVHVKNDLIDGLERMLKNCVYTST
ncbi:MAG: RNA-binding domain-containing protein [Candidatus Bathyarchaeia archaeon]